MTTAAIILAGGESRRMGFPKALLTYRGETFAGRLIRIFAACSDSVILVTGADHERIAAAIGPGATLVFNPQWRVGQLTSLQAGLRALPPGVRRIAFTPVDHPAVRLETVQALLRSQAPFAIPRYRGRRGHPVVFDGSLAPEFLALESTVSARVIRERYVSAIEYIDCDDAGVVADIDDPAAYRDLVEAASR